MPLYFFDIIDGGSKRDDVGTECVNDDDMRRAAISALPAIASDEIADTEERRFFTVVARNARREPIYTATLSFAGLWLDDRAPR